MPWKLISFLSGLILVTVFIGFNLDNRCDISLIFYTFRDVPIAVSLLLSYTIGALTLIPYFVVAGKKQREKERLSPPGSARKRAPKEPSRPSFSADGE